MGTVGALHGDSGDFAWGQDRLCMGKVYSLFTELVMLRP